MAKFNSTTFGTISGRHGSAVAATTKDGSSYLRVYRAPSDPKSAKQIAQRAKFAFANSSLSCFKNLFKETFNNRRGLNMGVSGALKDAISGEYPDYVLDYSLLKFSTGSVNQALTTKLEIVADTKVRISWSWVEAMMSKSDDKVNLIFFNEETMLTLHQKEVCKRDIESAEVILPEAWKGSTVICWLYLTTMENQLMIFSTSQFIGELEL